MKNSLFAALALTLLSALTPRLSTVSAQGTAFTYQGRLQNNGSPASGSYAMTFALFNTNASGVAIAGPVTNNAVSATNGLFTTTIDFGAEPFTGATNWLQIGVATNGVSSFTPLSPRQQLTPVPYAIFAGTASNLSGPLPAAQVSGTLTNGQFANSSVTVAAGPGLSGGGTVALGGSTTLNNAGVLSVTGNADITTATAAGVVALGDTGTNTAAPNRLVKRDATGSFAATNLTLYGTLTMGTPTDYHAVINELGGNTFVYADANNNFSAGEGAGYGPGYTLGYENTAIGNYALENTIGGSFNTSVGWGTMAENFYGSNNTAVGYSALGQLGSVGQIGGANNLALGYQAGCNFTGVESNNIDIGNFGNTGENNTIRLGTPGIQTGAYLAGVINGNGSGLTNLNAAQLASGTVPLAQLSGITSNQLSALTWQLATNLNGGNAALASNVVSGISITNAFITNSIFAGNGSGLTNLNASQLSSGTVPLAQLSGITSNQLNATTWQLATNLNGGNAALASNVVSGLSITNAFITNSVFAGNGGGLTNLNGAQLNGPIPMASLPATAVTNTETGVTLSGTFSGNGSSLTGLNASQLGSGVVPLNVLPGFQASGNYSTVNGGQGNVVSGQWATIGGGNQNTNTDGGGTAATIGGGQNNIITNGYQPTIGGGYGNTASANYATIAGGNGNTASGQYAFIGGGQNNTASGPQATVAGGSGNTATGTNATVAGGLNNLASTNEATVGGGRGNAANGGFQPTVSGGFDNTAGTNYATVAGGRNNTNNGIAATISGGDNNNASVAYVVIAGGQNNNASGGYAAIGGGQNNTNSSNAGAISGGQDNIAGGQYQAAVGGGYDNQATANYATVPGGYQNTAGGQYSLAAGQQAQALNQGAFVWADSQNAVFSSTANDQFLIRAQGGVGINTTTPNGAALAVEGSATGGFATPMSLMQNNSTAAAASPALRVVGYGNTPNGVLSVSDQGTGLIAQFGNAGAFVSQLDTNGNWTANSFNGSGSGLTTLNASSLASGTIPNSVLSGFQGNADVVGGGQNNTSSGTFQSAVGGGYANTASANYATVAGGLGNSASGGYAAIGGGEVNTNSSQAGTIAGGQNNVATGQYQSTVGGGYANQATNSYATVPGGSQNIAGGKYSLAAGQQAQAVHQGAFVWADSQNAAFPSTANDQFSVRAQGGVKFVTAGAGVTVDGQPMAKSYGTPISSAPFTISQPGSYYLTTNLTVHNTDAIDIDANGVTLDLNGFTISATSADASANAIYLALSNTATTFGNTDITISNGHIVSGVTNNNGTFEGPGFFNGIQANARPNNILVSGVSVSGVMGNGIDLFPPQSVGGVVSSTEVESCTVYTAGGDGIDADGVSHCTAYACGGYGIYASTVSDCHGESPSDPGIFAQYTAINCYGTSVGADGIFAYSANNCFGVSTDASGLFAVSASGCYGYSVNDFGFSVSGSANGCFGYSVNSYGIFCVGSAIGCNAYSQNYGAIFAVLANSCSSDSGTGTTNYIFNQYNMP